ncbi:MAG: CoA pyrophosphatase [Bacteroidota bacterium]
MTNALIPRLQERLLTPLPGKEAQLAMTSRPYDRAMEPSADHRTGGVLALLYSVEGILHMVFMKRTEDGRVHSGQVSFPGGKVEPEDESPVHTALREAEEELGIPANEVQVIGQLTPMYIPPSNFLVYPTVGFLPQRPDFVPSPLEVAAVIETPLAHLLDANTQHMATIHLPQHGAFQAPAFEVPPYQIWGATAMMLNELLMVIRELSQQ